MVTHLFMQAKTLRQIFLWPALIAVLSLAGLISALIYDDVRELISDAAIALPILIAFYLYWLKPKKQSAHEAARRRK